MIHSTQRSTATFSEATTEHEQVSRFERLVLPHLDAAVTLARYLVRDPVAAEDAVQEASLRAWRALDRLRRDDDARAWLLTIVRHACYRLARQRRASARDDEFDELQHGAEDAETADAEALRGDARETVARALDRLPAEYREVIVLRELEGLSYRAIGEITGVPIGTVMSRLSRARARLRLALGPLTGA